MTSSERSAVLFVRITQGVKEAFREYVVSEHGTANSMGFVVDQILSAFLSFGAGVQTTAMLILIAKGEIEADAVIFA